MAAGLLYVSVLISFIPQVRRFDEGLTWIFLILVVTWLGDTGAYFAGRAFGKTKLFDGIEEAAKIAKPWRINSALLVIVSDGDTVSDAGMPELPPSFGGTLVVGVGDHLSGSFIAGQQSRQDESTLRSLAIRLGGEFHNGNRRQVPSDMLSAAAEDSRKPLLERLTLREYALIAVLMSAAIIGLLPILLHYLGTRWRPGLLVAREAA